MQYNTTTKNMELILKNEFRQKKLIERHNKKLSKLQKKRPLNKYRRINKADKQQWKYIAIASIIANICFLINMTLQLVNN